MRFEGTQCLRSRFCFSVFSLLFLFILAPISLFGRELDFRGQKVTVEGLAEGDWEYVGGAPNSGTEELILVFKDTASAGTLSVPYGFEAQMLLVGGGGAGGYGTTGTTNPGGGGGGEVVERENNGRGFPRPFCCLRKNLIRSEGKYDETHNQNRDKSFAWCQSCLSRRGTRCLRLANGG